MDIANLQAFVVVADIASFSLAGEKLHLTQPAISKRISTLEGELNVRLFDRLGRKILLTEAGLTLLPRARRILEEMEDSRRALLNLSGQVAGTLILGTSHHIGLHRLPPVLRAFTSRYPQVQLDMRFMGSEIVCETIVHGEVELGIVTLPLQPQHPIKTIPIWDDLLLPVINQGHPLTKLQRISPDQLGAYRAILPGKGTFTRELIDHAFESVGIQVEVAFSTNYLETIKMMVSVGLGWSILPQNILDTELAVLELKDLHVQRSLGAVQHSERTLSNAAQAMLDILTEPGRVDPTGHKMNRKD